VDTKPSSQPPHLSTDALDYVDLWKYFEDRGYEVKQTMLKVTTWIIGFAAMALCFIMKECLTYPSSGFLIKIPLMLIITSSIGLLITWYADIVIRDFGTHINRHFDRADAARRRNEALCEIWKVGDYEGRDQKAPAAKNQKRLPPICRTLRRVVWRFGIIFGAGLILAIISLCWHIF
jgi:hypothetical protein